MKTEQQIREKIAELVKENEAWDRIASKNLSIGAFLAVVKEGLSEKNIKVLKWVLDE